jgi:hypothetical protein
VIAAARRTTSDDQPVNVAKPRTIQRLKPDNRCHGHGAAARCTEVLPHSSLVLLDSIAGSGTLLYHIFVVIGSGLACCMNAEQYISRLVCGQ